ncbi:hypothetical protein ACFWM0_23575 [Streptomyces sp. NPDC058405]|uniref:hypothetical protein n=1 Tax=Streptomyces sp. NPDC058405 TaxID=3346482 RepID=UPI0036690AF0
MLQPHREQVLGGAFPGGVGGPRRGGDGVRAVRAYWFGPGLLDQVPEGARTERLMGLRELAVRPPWQSQGI